MRRLHRLVPPGLGYVLLLAAVAALTVSYGDVLPRSSGAAILDAVAAASLYGSQQQQCSPTGGAGCADNHHACSTTGCATTSTTCHKVGTYCVKLSPPGGAVTFPCDKPQPGGYCCAVGSTLCHGLLYGYPDAGGNCKLSGTGYDRCENVTYCGEAYYQQAPCP